MSKPVNPLLITHASVEIAALPAAGSAGAWNKLVPAGTFSARDGRGPFVAGGKAEMEGIVARTRQMAGATDLVVDYDHQSFLSAVKGVGGTAKAAGWIKDLEVREDGIWGLIEWTPVALRALKRGEYRYLSPSFHNDKSGKIHTILNAGLLNMPAMDLVAIAAGADHSTDKEDDVKNIAKALGLEDSASEETILAAINTLSTDRTRVLTTAGLKAEATTDDLVTTLSTLKTSATPDPTKFVPIEQVTLLQNEVKELKASVTGDKAEAEVTKAIEDGKLTPALKDWAIDLFKADASKFATFIGSAPVLTATQLGSKKVDPAANDDTLTEADEKTISMMGLDRAEFIKIRKAEKTAA